jgi:four helix bundle protein
MWNMEDGISNGQDTSEYQEKIRAFTDLITWQEGHALVLSIYRETSLFSRDELFGLTSQMRRSAISITSNIAEGFGRRSMKEKLQFYFIARGSLIELYNQLIIAKDVGYMTTSIFEQLEAMFNKVHRLLNGLITKTKESVL